MFSFLIWSSALLQAAPFFLNDAAVGKAVRVFISGPDGSSDNTAFTILRKHAIFS
jgi:hypothetical protein